MRNFFGLAILGCAMLLVTPASATTSNFDFADLHGCQQHGRPLWQQSQSTTVGGVTADGDSLVRAKHDSGSDEFQNHLQSITTIV